MSELESVLALVLTFVVRSQRSLEEMDANKTVSTHKMPNCWYFFLDITEQRSIEKEKNARALYNRFLYVLIFNVHGHELLKTM